MTPENTVGPVGIATVLLQDYFHRGIFKSHIGERQWTRFESRLDRHVDETLRLLDSHHVKATFFSLGWIADRYPGIIRRLVAESHEVASAGYWARAIAEMSPEQFRDDIRRSKQAIEGAAGTRVIGYRAAYLYISRPTWWAFDILVQEGYVYDASYRPRVFDPFRRDVTTGAREIETESNRIHEIPLSSRSVGPFRIPISGGSYIRLLPSQFTFKGFLKWSRNRWEPFVLYFHPWELDSDQPQIQAIGPLKRMRQYSNLGRFALLLPRYFERVPFKPVRDYLGMGVETVNGLSKVHGYSTTGQPHAHGPEERSSKKPVSVVVPCFNETDSLPFLDKALEELSTVGGDEYEYQFVFIDDKSTDNTLEALIDRFGCRSNCRVVAHKRNGGIARAIATGIKESTTEIVCSMDADCSYDPVELTKMIPMLGPGIDLVTASPYHHDGFVLGVPKWRLALSRTLSRMYRVVLRHKLWTYTSCFRVYRRNAVDDIELLYGDFRGILEMLVRLEQNGGGVSEFPTTLQSRIFGYSKMKTVRTIAGHLKLMWQLFVSRRVPLENAGTRSNADVP